MNHNILILARATKGDTSFYKRWQILGKVHKGLCLTRDARVIDILVVDFRTKVDKHLVEKYPSLKYVVSATTGHTHLDPSLLQRGIEFITLRGETAFLRHIHSVSEFVLSLMFRLARPTSSCGILLRGKTVGILGHGRIGGQVRGLAAAIGMKTLIADVDTTFAGLLHLFIHSDFVTIHIPETDLNKKFVGKHLLSRMKRHAFFINTSRGSVVDELYLSQMLREGRLAAAAVDTIEDAKVLNESVPNLLLTSHVAGSTVEDRILTDKFMLDKTYHVLRARIPPPSTSL